MITEIISQIVEAENKAESIVRAASEQASLTAQKAQNDAEEAAVAVQLQAKAACKKIEQDARDRAESEAQRIKKNAGAEIEAVVAKGSKNIDKAASFVAEQFIRNI